MMTKTSTNFRAIRLKPETIERLQDMKLAFEMSYCKTMFNDEFIQKLLDSVEDGEPGVWEYYCRIVLKKEEDGK